MINLILNICCILIFVTNLESLCLNFPVSLPIPNCIGISWSRNKAKWYSFYSEYLRYDNSYIIFTDTRWMRILYLVFYIVLFDAWNVHKCPRVSVTAGMGYLLQFTNILLRYMLRHKYICIYCWDICTDRQSDIYVYCSDIFAGKELRFASRDIKFITLYAQIC